MGSLLDDILAEHEFDNGLAPDYRKHHGPSSSEVRLPCSTPCPSLPPAEGRFSAPNSQGHRWFTPKYKRYPTNLWHLAKLVRKRMLAGRAGRTANLQTESEIRRAIRSHPCNRHFTKSKPMFMPRFGPDRCTGRGRYYGAIYIPFAFDDHTPKQERKAHHPELGHGTSVPSLSLPDLCRVAIQRSCAVQPTRPCFPDQKDDRVPVPDTNKIPNRWICEIILLFREPIKRGALWAFSAGSGLLISRSHILTSAHVLQQKIDFGTISVVRSAIAAVILFGFSSEKMGGNKVFSFAPVMQKRQKAFRVPQEWKDHLRGASGESFRFDYGLISLSGSAICSPRLTGSSGIFPGGFWGEKNSLTRIAPTIKGFRYSNLKGSQVQMAGYPGDLPCLQWASSGKLIDVGYGGSRRGRPHYKGTARHDFLMYDFDSARGMSGSPVWGRMSLKGKSAIRREERVLVGIHSGCGRATAITPFVWEKRLRRWMEEI